MDDKPNTLEQPIIGEFKQAGNNPYLQIGHDENGRKISQNGKLLGRRPSNAITSKLKGFTKSEMRELYNAAFDSNAPLLFSQLLEYAKTDKDLLKYVIDQRIGKAAQQVTGDESAPLTVIIKRGLDAN